MTSQSLHVTLSHGRIGNGKGERGRRDLVGRDGERHLTRHYLIPAGVQKRHLFFEFPRLGDGRGQFSFLVEELFGATLQETGVNEGNRGRGWHEVEQRPTLGGEPREPTLHAVEGLPLG